MFTIVHYDAECFISSDWSVFEHCEIDETYGISVIQRIPTAYKSGDKVLVLSNPFFNEDIEAMVWNVCIVRDYHDAYYTVYADDKSKYYIFPYYCLAPVFEEDSLSGKEAKVVIDGKEYSVTLKLI